MTPANHQPHRHHHSIPPPPHTPRSNHHDNISSLYPPPPANVDQAYMIHPILHEQNTSTYPTHNPYGNPAAPYPMGWYAQHPQFQQQYAYPSYPPPPPPPRTNHSQLNCTQSNNQHTQPINMNHTRPNDNPKAKKISPKLLKKYSGRGLKTITISGPGLPTQKFKICVGNHPDDVKKWIEERRRRFPRHGGNFDAGKSVNDFGNNDVGGAMVGNKRRLESDDTDVKQKKACLGGDCVTANYSNGLSSLLAGYDSSSSEDGEEKDQNTAGNGEPHKCPVDKEKSTENPSETKRQTTTLQDPSKSPTRRCKFFQRGKCRHGNSCKFLHTTNIDKDATQSSKRLTQSQHDKSSQKYQAELRALDLISSDRNRGNKPVNSTSLLNKLLQRDKERERRLTLQLLRYIVDCDYFQGADA